MKKSKKKRIEMNKNISHDVSVWEWSYRHVMENPRELYEDFEETYRLIRVCHDYLTSPKEWDNARHLGYWEMRDLRRELFALYSEFINSVGASMHLRLNAFKEDLLIDGYTDISKKSDYEYEKVSSRFEKGVK